MHALLLNLFKYKVGFRSCDLIVKETVWKQWGRVDFEVPNYELVYTFQF